MATLSTAPLPSTGDNSDKGKNNEEMNVLVPEDAALFGRLNSQIADEWADLVEHALTSGIASLPLMQDETQKHLLENVLRPKYWRNIDISEVFCGRNIFSLSMFPPKRRARIAEACLGDGTLTSTAPLKDVTTEKSNETDLEEDNNNNITVESIPTPQQLSELQTQGQSLRQRLLHAKRQRAAAQRALAQAQAAAELAQQAVQVTNQVQDGQVIQSVSETVQNATALAETKNAGIHLAETMERKKQDRKDDDQAVVIAVPPAKKVKTLQEQYEQDQKAIGAVHELQQVHKMLQKRQN